MEEAKNIYQKLFEVKKAGIKLQRDTKAFNYKYATLSQIQDKFSEVIQEQGLLIVHYISENRVCTEIINIDNPKEVATSWITMTEWTKPQDKGSEITYYRRYNLLSLLDLEVEDDDGKKAQESKPKLDKNWAYKWDSSQLELTEYIAIVQDETDVNNLDNIYKDFARWNWSDKQKKWMVEECAKKKAELIGGVYIPKT